MSDQKKLNSIKLTTPRGIAIYPHLTAPDTKFNPEGDFSVKLRVPEDEAAEFTEKLRKFNEVAFSHFKEAETNPAKRAKLQQADLPVQPEYNDAGELTGNVLISCKAKALIPNSKTGEKEKRVLKFFDAAGNPLPKTPEIWGGSVLKVAVQAAPYKMESTKQVGITLRISAVQVIQLQNGSGGDAGSYGFDAEEGYEASEDDAFTPEVPASTTSTDSDMAGNEF